VRECPILVKIFKNRKDAATSKKRQLFNVQKPFINQLLAKA
jgi:hypothetical protein